MIRALGKLPARPGSVSLRFSAIFRAEKLPTPPAVFGHESRVPSWGMYANDQWGDCVWAGAAHEHSLWTRAGAGPAANFSDSSVLSDYAAVTGFAYTPQTDSGTDVQAAASYRRQTGIADASGGRHRILAYMSLRPGDFDELMLATWLFGAVGFGMRFPSSAEEQFDALQPWSVVTGDKIEGGHYVSVVGRNSAGNALCITWGRLHAITPQFYEQYCDESVAYFCPEYVNKNNLSPEGFDAAALGQFLKELS